MAAVVETYHDERGIMWPLAVAPYEVVVTMLSPADDDSQQTAIELYEKLSAQGAEVLLDDRDERPGVKFADAELIGIPYRVTVGPRGLERGVVEVTERGTGQTEEVSVDEAGELFAQRLDAARS